MLKPTHLLNSWCCCDLVSQGAKQAKSATFPRPGSGAAALMVVSVDGGPVEVVRASAMEGNGSDRGILPNSLIQATRQALI